MLSAQQSKLSPQQSATSAESESESESAGTVAGASVSGALYSADCSEVLSAPQPVRSVSDARIAVNLTACFYADGTPYQDTIIVYDTVFVPVDIIYDTLILYAYRGELAYGQTNGNTRTLRESETLMLENNTDVSDGMCNALTNVAAVLAGIRYIV